jgi:hypothetical protein
MLWPHWDLSGAVIVAVSLLPTCRSTCKWCGRDSYYGVHDRGAAVSELLDSQSKRWRRRLGSISPGAVLVAVLGVCTVLLCIYTIRKTDDIPAYIPAAAPTSTIAASAPALPLPAPPMVTSAMAKPVRDKDIEFLVGSIQPLAGAPASPGAFQVVSVTMTNTGTAPWQVDLTDQRLVDDQGHDYPPDTALSGQLNNGVSTVLKPGHFWTMSIAFAAPIGIKPAAVVLREGPLTPGVAVALK